MEPKVPSGLLTMSQSPSELLGRGKLDVTAIKSFWQAFYVSRQASNTQTDRRLEYLFWRIWSSETLQDDASIESLDRLVSRIMSSSETIKPHVHPSSEPALPSPGLLTAPRPIRHTSSKSQSATRSKSPLPPILKKPQSVQGDVPKSARLLLEKPDGESVTLNPSTPPNPGSTELNVRRNSAGGKTSKKPQTNSSRPGRGPRRRSVFNRRKSSQPAIPKANPPLNQRLVSSHPARLDDPIDPLLNADLMSPHELSHAEIHAGVEPEDSWADEESVDPIITRPSRLAASPATSLTERTHPLRTLRSALLFSKSQTSKTPFFPKGFKRFSDAFPGTPMESISSTDTLPGIFLETARSGEIPGLINAKRVPMPRSMVNDLLDIIENPKPVKGRIPLPVRPWLLAEHAWYRLPEQHYLFDWMILEKPTLYEQPSERRLVEREFRQDFADQMEYQIGMLAEIEQARQVALALEQSPTRETWKDSWDSDIPTLAHSSREAILSEYAESN
ncbi:uncharacterized protein N7477_007974 [Penicillium maclennaniae]|uniref:uncharacterized protein n=1 Tax=Penicillium maclennaniae TaxID=1343394 RepID=UPI00253F718A|nr:uncharacterized protein N7477_007974 [Penicillium maclennaniae]KAJ5665526.1 hypothetical protein N7477_007974 [Penicillium maclennaniae]